MTGRVQRAGGFARKALGAKHAGMGHALARRSVLLQAAGVRMPIMTYREEADEISYPWIYGTSGAERLRALLAGSSGRDWEGVIGAACADLLRPLVRLHAASPQNLALAPFDAWRRIRPRIEVLAQHAAEPTEVALRDEVLAAYQALRGAVVRRADTAGWGPVHGDYHVGQILFEPGADEAWLLDADDLALGPPESDLGNFIAHLATSDHVGSAPPSAAFPVLALLILPGYDALSGRTIEAREVGAYGAVALLRRALKLRERGDPDERVGAILAAAKAALRGAGV